MIRSGIIPPRAGEGGERSETGGDVAAEARTQHAGPRFPTPDGFAVCPSPERGGMT
jgi:hypothetical protein